MRDTIHRFIQIMMVLVLIAPLTCFAQQLILKQKGKIKYTFVEGEKIRFKLNDEKHFREVLITGFTKDEIVLHYFTVQLSEIDQVDIIKKAGTGLTSTLSKVLIRAGIFFLSIDQINRVFVNGRHWGIDGKTALIGTAMIGQGLIFKLVSPRGFKVSRKNRLAIM